MERDVLDFQNQEEQDKFCDTFKSLLEKAYERKIESEENKRSFLVLNCLLGLFISVPAVSKNDVWLLILAMSLAFPSWFIYREKGEKIEYFKDKIVSCDSEFDLNEYQKDFSEEEIREIINVTVNNILESDMS